MMNPPTSRMRIARPVNPGSALLGEVECDKDGCQREPGHGDGKADVDDPPRRRVVERTFRQSRPAQVFQRCRRCDPHVAGKCGCDSTTRRKPSQCRMSMYRRSRSPRARKAFTTSREITLEVEYSVLHRLPQQEVSRSKQLRAPTRRCQACCRSSRCVGQCRALLGSQEAAGSPRGVSKVAVHDRDPSSVGFRQTGCDRRV